MYKPGDTHSTRRVICCTTAANLHAKSWISVITADMASYPGVAKVNMLSLSLGQQTKGVVNEAWICIPAPL